MQQFQQDHQTQCLTLGEKMCSSKEQNVLIHSLLQITTLCTVCCNASNAQIWTCFSYLAAFIVWTGAWKARTVSRLVLQTRTMKLQKPNQEKWSVYVSWFSCCQQSISIRMCYSSSQRMHLRTVQITTPVLNSIQTLCLLCFLTFSLFQSEEKLEQRRYHIVCHISHLRHCSFKAVINEAEVLQFHEFSGLCMSCKVTDWLIVSSKKTYWDASLVASSSLFCVYVCLFSSEYPRVAISCVISSLTLWMIWNFVSK